MSSHGPGRQRSPALGCSFAVHTSAKCQLTVSVAPANAPTLRRLRRRRIRLRVGVDRRIRAPARPPPREAASRLPVSPHARFMSGRQVPGFSKGHDERASVSPYSGALEGRVGHVQPTLAVLLGRGVGDAEAPPKPTGQDALPIICH